ncbi:hypothetical protein EV421DRAFT_1730898 [Armillaria borealis]|uniref:Uncharacterized protein n=1 Tax=Armillaria borealis TaxID=47425 RepID=A0AA39K431_9AGAR|nr:hypothetical protein EV421DRAFT_1730898 [Armillaria borealis]
MMMCFIVRAFKAEFPEMDTQGKDDERDPIFEAVRYWFYNDRAKIRLRGPWYIKWLSPRLQAMGSRFHFLRRNTFDLLAGLMAIGLLGGMIFSCYIIMFWVQGRVV